MTERAYTRYERSEPVPAPDVGLPLTTVEPDRVTQAGRCGVPLAEGLGPVPRRIR
jgi:hypothetical protein